MRCSASGSEAVHRRSGTATDRNGPRKSGLPDLRMFEGRSRVNPRSVSAAHRYASLHAALRPGHEPIGCAMNLSRRRFLYTAAAVSVAPVCGLIDFPLVLVANPAVPAKTVAELIAYAKANPGKISIGSFGTGSTSHVAGELSKMMAGVNMIHVPYRGGAPMVADLIGGQ